jgi:hypothetical protein
MYVQAALTGLLQRAVSFPPEELGAVANQERWLLSPILEGLGKLVQGKHDYQLLQSHRYSTPWARCYTQEVRRYRPRWAGVAREFSFRTQWVWLEEDRAAGEGSSQGYQWWGDIEAESLTPLNLGPEWASQTRSSGA